MTKYVLSALLLLLSVTVNANAVPPFNYAVACSEEFFYEAGLMDDVRERYPKGYFFSVQYVEKKTTKCDFFFEDIAKGEKEVASYTYTYFELEKKWKSYYKNNQ